MRRLTLFALVTRPMLPLAALAFEFRSGGTLRLSATVSP